MDWPLILEALKWPVAVIILTFILRRPLGKLIPKLKLLRLEKGRLEIQFIETQRLEALAEKAGIPTKKIGRAGAIIGSSQEEYDHTSELIELSPRGAVLSGWVTLKKALYIAATNRGVEVSPHTESTEVLSRLLADGVISKEMGELCLDLYEIGRKFADVPTLLPDKEGTTFYTQLVERVADWVFCKVVA